MTIAMLAVAVVGLVVGFYWARVLKLVRKTRRKAGASAQLLPAEPVGRLIRLLWYPTVAVWLVHPWLMLWTGGEGTGIAGWLTRPLLPPGWPATALAVAGAIGAVATLLATMVCWRRMGRSWRMGIKPGERTELVVTGPYAVVAHPIYALQQGLVVSSFLAMPTLTMLAVMLVEICFLHWEAAREERHLLSVHGAAYGEYRSRVGRFLPRWA